jgi:hypothetical protein
MGIFNNDFPKTMKNSHRIFYKNKGVILLDNNDKKIIHVGSINENYVIPYYDEEYLVDYEKDIKYDNLIKELILIWNS